MVGQRSAEAQLRKGALEFCVLALLESGERYGYDLVRALSEVDGLVTSEGTIYPLLTRLNRQGSVEATWQESAAGPPRKYYRITEQGRAELSDFRLDWQRFTTAVDSLINNGGRA